MKKILYILSLAALVCACDKNDVIEAQLELDNIYVITDDPNDAVKHRTYEIYEKYGVPVYFNDTIGEVLVGTTASGDPYYRYETIDLSWTFDTYQRLTYQFEYITDPELQLEMLDVVEYYLENAAAPLWPYMFFITKSMQTVSRDGKNTVSKVNSEYQLGNFRVITFIVDNWEAKDPMVVMDELKMKYVSEKIAIFTEDVEAFGTVSHDYYDAFWDALHTALGTTLEDDGYGVAPMVINGYDLGAYLGEELSGYWDESLNEWIDAYYTRVPSLHSLINYVYTGSIMSKNRGRYTAEELEVLWDLGHYAIGVFGFVSGNPVYPATRAVADVDSDLSSYLNIILNTTDADFRAEWGSCPMVMEKYEILYRVITEELGLTL